MNATTFDWVDEAESAKAGAEDIAPGAVILRGFARDRDRALLDAVARIVAEAPLRRWQTPGGKTMSVAMTNCGRLGWISDRRGYRYDAVDPARGCAWPAMPASFSALAAEAARAAGYPGFLPQACLVNEYRPGSRLSLHQDRDELDLAAPIVSVSLGLPAVFLFGGQQRAQRPHRFRLLHGDVVVWGGASRLAHHGVTELAHGEHPLAGTRRVNLTFRKVEQDSVPCRYNARFTITDGLHQR